jgi:hypothetical protein
MVYQSAITTTPASSLRLARNQAGSGGGMLVAASAVRAQGDARFAENRASAWGGGLLLESTSWTAEGPASFTGARARRAPARRRRRRRAGRGG